MAEDYVVGIIGNVQLHVEGIVQRLGLEAPDHHLEVCRMGSREYGLSLIHI